MVNEYNNINKYNYQEENVIEDLIISSKFPPLNDVSGKVLSKRVIISGKTVDVIQAKLNEPEDNDFNKLIEKYIANRLYVKNMGLPNSLEAIIQFRREGIKLIEKHNTEYKHILSRSWTIESHILALEYKLRHPEVIWTAEFSDPLFYDIDNNIRKDAKTVIEDKTYLDWINGKIDKLNDKFNKTFPHISSKDGRYFLGEYLPFLFADIIRFTNKNQRTIMLKQFPYDMDNFVRSKSEVNPHPTLSNEYYYIKKVDYSVNENILNFGYFGTYIGKRHLEFLFYAFERLSKDLKKKIKLHLFVSNQDFVKSLIKDLELSQFVFINKTVPLLEFLNISTKMDVLIVTDSITKNSFDINPYLPSKLADYKGTGNDIWAICEQNSIMDGIDFKYKSDVESYGSVIKTLDTILFDKLNQKVTSNTLSQEVYLKRRITDLNCLYDLEYKQKNYWINQYRILDKKYNATVKDLSSKYNGLKKLDDKNNKYTKLYNITKNSFDKIEHKNQLINDKNEEITYYKNQGFFEKIFSNYLSMIYLKLKSHQNYPINKKIYKLLKNSNWMNNSFYLKTYHDLSRFKWSKIFTPELHFVLYGFDEGRTPQRDICFQIKTKQNLIKQIQYFNSRKE